jgi:hypothetical protein
MPIQSVRRLSFWPVQLASKVEARSIICWTRLPGGVRPGDLQGDGGVEGAVAAGGEEVRGDLMAGVEGLVAALVVRPVVLGGRIEVDQQIGRMDRSGTGR